LRHCTDTSAADWLVNSGTPPEQLITFGPARFESYARLRFIPDPTHPGQQEHEADVPDDHPLDELQATRALGILAAFTDTPEECYFCFWEGMAGDFLSSDVLQGPMVAVPHRRYALFKGELGNELTEVPAFVWPADHRWCFTSDVDPHWAGIGAERAAIDALLADPELDVVAARPDETPPAYR
jgi:hypothetical protein